MGYDTYWGGSLTPTPALNEHQIAYLTEWLPRQHPALDVDIIRTYDDPLREAVFLPPGPNGILYAGPEIKRGAPGWLDDDPYELNLPDLPMLPPIPKEIDDRYTIASNARWRDPINRPPEVEAEYQAALAAIKPYHDARAETQHQRGKIVTAHRRKLHALDGYTDDWTIETYDKKKAELAPAGERGDKPMSLAWLIFHIFEPWAISLNGELYWDGEDSEDKGIMRVRDNIIRTAQAQIVYPEHGLLVEI